MSALLFLYAGLSQVQASAPVQARGGDGGRLMLTLQDCRDMALVNGASVRNARLDRLAAQAQKQEALAEYFPQVSASAFGFWAVDPMLEIGVKDIVGDNDLGNNLQNYINAVAPQYGIAPVYTALKYGYTASVSLMQPLFAGGRIVNGNRLASLGVEAAGHQENLSARSLNEEVGKNYWQVVALEEKLVTLEALGTLLDTLHKDVSAAVSAGLAVSTDKMQVELKKNELRSGMTQLKGGIRLAKMNLLNSVGQDYSLVMAVADSLRPYIDDIILTDRLEDLAGPDAYYVPEEEIVAGLDEARLLDLAVRAKALEKKMTLGEALPSVGAGVSYGYGHFLNGRSNCAVYGMVKIPISDWGKVSRKMQRQEYQLQKAQNERDWLGAQLLLQVRQLWLDLQTAWEQMEVAREGSALARETADRMRVNYDAGLASMSELLQAQTALRQADEAYVDSRIAYSSALVAYRGRIGDCADPAGAGSN